MALAAGVTADRISFGNTIKKQRHIADAYGKGVRLFAFDAEAELDKLIAQAPGSTVFCRVLCDGSGADWPLSRKFGCEPEEALRHAIDARGGPDKVADAGKLSRQSFYKAFPITGQGNPTAKTMFASSRASGLQLTFKAA